MENKIRYLFVGGYGWSGSSLLIDVLNTLEIFQTLQDELRFLTDPDGFQDLERALISDWNLLNSDTAIKRFLEYVEILHRKSTKYSKYGYNYCKIINPKFKSISYEFIEQLTEFKYKGYWYHTFHKWSKNYIFMRKLIYKLFKVVLDGNEYMYFSKPELEEFQVKSKKYFDKVFEGFFDENKKQILIIDQGNREPNMAKSLEYFNDAKIIIVDRDPRDIYIDLKKRGALIGNYFKGNGDNSEIYVRYHKSIREKQDRYLKNNQILKIRFEDLIYHFEKTIRKVMNFIGIETNIEDFEAAKEIILNSSKNAGIWRFFDNQKIMEEIHVALKEDCYGFDKTV